MVCEIQVPLVQRQLEVLSLALDSARITMPETLHELARRCRCGATILRKSGLHASAERLSEAGELLVELLNLAQPMDGALGLVARIVESLKRNPSSDESSQWEAELTKTRLQVESAEISSWLPVCEIKAALSDAAECDDDVAQRVTDWSHRENAVARDAAFLDEVTTQLHLVEADLCALISGHRSARTYAELLRHWHSLKALASLAGQAEIARVSHASEEVMQLVHSGIKSLDEDAINAMLKSHDWIGEQVASLKADIIRDQNLDRPQPHSQILDLIGCCVPSLTPRDAESSIPPTTKSVEIAEIPTVSEPVAASSTSESQNLQGEPTVSCQSIQGTEAACSTAPVSKAGATRRPTSTAPPAAAIATNAATAAAPSVKVDRRKLDELVDLIGELAFATTMLETEWKEHMPPECRHSSTLSRVKKHTKELQARGLTLRAMPIDGVFKRMSRVVFDLARKIGKPTELVIEGGETEMDKTIVDQVADPLMHLIRNSMDHGIESSAEERQQAGKPPQAKITLRALQRNGSVFVEVEDDGRGLNRARIRQKAIERGLIEPDRSLSDGETCRLIFHPGFSTAEKLTEISGRGVGMDVVKQNIEALNGAVDIHSQEGKGTTVSLRLPLTLAMLDGLVARVGTERFIVPIARVQETIILTAEQTEEAIRDGNRLMHRGVTVPTYELGELLDVPIDPTMRRIGVIVETQCGLVCLLVDDVLGRQQVTQRPLGIDLPSSNRFAGGAVLADGRVSLILELDQLLTAA